MSGVAEKDAGREVVDSVHAYACLDEFAECHESAYCVLFGMSLSSTFASSARSLSFC